MSNVKDLYRAHYEFYETCHNRKCNKYHWAANDIFDLTTYDGSLDELFVDTILEVCKVIYERRNFEYIKNQQNYVKYILVCQLLDAFHWIEWGTSIRGAWFEGYHPNCETRVILGENEWSEHTKNGWEDHILQPVPFSEDNLKALLEFIEE